MRKLSFSPRRALCWFGFKQTLKGAIIVGVIAGFMLALQGTAYQKSYPDAIAREKLAASLASVPSLGFLYGDSKNLTAGTAGYMVYRVVGFMGVVTGVWALMATTKLLRGSEEDGRWETVRAGAVTARTTTSNAMAGFGLAWALAAVISLLLAVAATTASGIQLSFTSAVLITLAIFLPGLLFGAVGVLTSQLAITRQRALLYGLVPLVALFLLRGIGITSDTLHWLLNWTPFGWAELVNPVLAPQAWWLAPFAVLGGICAAAGVWLAQRDFGASILRQSDTARSHYSLLTNAWRLALRQSAWVLTGWAVGILTLIGLVAGLTTTAVNATEDSSGLSRSIHALAHNNADLKVAFLGAGMLFMVIALLVMAITIVGAIWRDEAKQYLDNILVAPRRRATWLVSRLLLGFGIVLAISLAGGLLLYAVASGQGVDLNFGKVMATSVCVVGSVGFMIGLGALLYGLKPRLVVAAMYTILGWSFVITLVASAVKLNTAILHSSLFQYTSFNLAKWPDWTTFGWMMLIGTALATCGIVAFTKRDIIPE